MSSGIRSGNEKDQQITIQIGSFANYVGSHFWNFQDDIIRDLVPLENENEDNEDAPISYRLDRMYQLRNSNRYHLSMTPRVLMIDHRGSLGSLNPTGEDDNQDFDISTWNGDKSVIKKAKEEKNSFLRMLEQEQNYFWSGNETKNNDDRGEGEGEEDKEIDEDVRVDESMVKSWTDYSKVRFHPSAYCELPFWPISHPFDTYGSGASPDMIPPDQREEYFDRIRRLVEDCDWLRNMTVIADLNDGFGGITCALCQEIRDELPRITMPIWAFTDDSSSISPVTRIQQCNIPICYSALLSSDIASVLIPMSTFSAPAVSPFVDLQADLRYHTSSIFASALEISTGFQRISSTSSTHSSSNSLDRNTPESLIAGESITDVNWAAQLTNNYQQRLCTLEACLPFPCNPANDNNFAPLWNVLSSSSYHHQGIVNPFMSSLSSAVWGKYAAQDRVRSASRIRCSETNIINCRGFQSARFASELMSPASNCTNAPPVPYHVSSIHQRSYGLPIPRSFPALFRAVNSEGFVSFPSSTCASQVASVLFPLPPRDDRTRADAMRERERDQGSSSLSCDSVVGVTGMGFDSALMGSHVDTLLKIWREKDGATASSLVRSGLATEECNEIDENLATLASQLSTR